jgi:hypothetical protein
VIVIVDVNAPLDEPMLGMLKLKIAGVANVTSDDDCVTRELSILSILEPVILVLNELIPAGNSDEPELSVSIMLELATGEVFEICLESSGDELVPTLYDPEADDATTVCLNNLLSNPIGRAVFGTISLQVNVGLGSME